MGDVRQIEYDNEYYDSCIFGLYDLILLSASIFRYRRNYKRFNLYGKYRHINNYREIEDPFIEEFDELYNKYADIVEENKNPLNETQMNLLIKGIRSIIILYSSLVENAEFERVFTERIMRQEPLLYLIEDLKREFQTILFGYAETADNAHSPVLGTQFKPLNSLMLPEVKEAFSYPNVRTLNTYGYRYSTHFLPKSGNVTYQLEATNVLPLQLETRKRNKSKKVPKFRKKEMTKANKNTKKLKDIIKNRKDKMANSSKKVSKSMKSINMKRLGINI